MYLISINSYHYPSLSAYVRYPPQANNTVIVGLPVMQATFPDVGGRLSLLSVFVLFLQVIPFSITAFEVEKWMVDEHARTREAAEAAAAVAAAVSEPPGTPTRELSGRYDTRPDEWAGGSRGAGVWCDGDGGGGGREGDGIGDRRGSRGGGDGYGPHASGRGNGHGGRNGSVLGAVGRGWAPGTPISGSRPASEAGTGPAGGSGGGGSRRRGTSGSGEMEPAGPQAACAEAPRAAALITAASAAGGE
ncbi:hypothetical protein TSOC_014643, partial [Tetrabaena socialis]